MENSESKDQNETTQRSHGDERLTWHDRLERNIRSNWEVGELFTLSEVYDKFLDELAEAYPANRNLESTTRAVLQQLRQEDFLTFHGDRGEPTAGTYHRNRVAS